VNNVRREARRHFRNRKRKYVIDNINEFAANSNNKNIRNLYGGINGFKRGYQPRSNSVKDENCDLFADTTFEISGRTTFLSY
jgi:hypothetical protein